jgi:hypothetical protein
MNNFQQQPPTPAPPTPAPAGYSDRQFLHAEQAAVNVPIKQVIVTTVFVAIAILTISFMFDARDPFTVALYSLGITPLVMWLFLQRRWLHLTAERILNIDIPGGEAQKPTEARTVKIQIEQVKDGHYQSSIIDLPCTDDQLEALAVGLKSGRKFSEKEWAGPGRPFSIDGFRELKAVMLKRNLIVQKNEKDARQGFIPTDAGQALIEQYEPNSA